MSINVVICFLLDNVTKVEKAHSQNDETLSKFYKITILQFINYSVLSFVINFKFESFRDYSFLGIIPLFKGNYTDFTPDWYRQIGSSMCVTLTLNIVSPHFSKLILPGLTYLRRWYDRGFRCDLKYTEYKEADEWWRVGCLKEKTKISRKEYKDLVFTRKSS